MVQKIQSVLPAAFIVVWLLCQVSVIRTDDTDDTDDSGDTDDDSPSGLDCADIKKNVPTAESSIYYITGQPGGTLFRVYCDMTTTGGGWTVFQRRIDGSENFYRNWKEYADGFGELSKEFWLGNDHLALMTGARQYKLRIELGDWAGNTRYAEYSLFKVSDSSDKYRLSLGTYSGNAGSTGPFSYHSNTQFSTYDEDNDGWSSKSCAEEYRGAWWYYSCHYVNLNGEYNNTESQKGVNWYGWHGWSYSLRFTEMKIRPVTF